MLERLQKIISAAGVTSRRAAEQLIAEGRVRVNGQVVTEPGSKADPAKDHIKVDGKLINPHQPPTYIMLNKPSGYVTTMSDPEGRPTIQDLIKGVKTRVYPVGRLDYSTEGLLLLTNDGDFAHLITHPRHEFPKTYLAKVKGVLEESQIEKLETGIFLEDGKTAPARIRTVRKEEMNSWLEITIHEGRKRQVRRMFDHVGHSVIRLKRIKTGGLVLGDLPEGSFRHLTPEEVEALRETALKIDETGRQVPVFKPQASSGSSRESETGTVRRRASVEMKETRSGVRRNQGLQPSAQRPQKAGKGYEARGRNAQPDRWEQRTETPRFRPRPEHAAATGRSEWKSQETRTSRLGNMRQGQGTFQEGHAGSARASAFGRRENSKGFTPGPTRRGTGRPAGGPYRKSDQARTPEFGNRRPGKSGFGRSDRPARSGKSNFPSSRPRRPGKGRPH